MSRTTTAIIASAAAAASLLGVVGLTASSASAATTSAALTAIAHKSAISTATTVIRNRPDSGGNGYWANDNFTRVLTLTYEGKTGPAATPYAYTAQLSDKGTFLDEPGQFTPNQGGSDSGKVLKPVQVEGTMAGDGYFSVFYSSVKANSPRTQYNLGVEIAENDHGSVTGASFHPSSTWPELAFPAGTVFSGLSEIQFDYTYTVPAYDTYTFKTVNGKAVKVTHVHKAQTWEDASWNDAGQLPSDGNIIGR